MQKSKDQKKLSSCATRNHFSSHPMRPCMPVRLRGAAWQHTVGYATWRKGPSVRRGPAPKPAPSAASSAGKKPAAGAAPGTAEPPPVKTATEAKRDDIRARLQGKRERRLFYLLDGWLSSGCFS